VSFAGQDCAEIWDGEGTELQSLFPEYASEVEAFGRADPLADLRVLVAVRLLSTRCNRLTLHLADGRGGAADRFVAELVGLPRDADHEVCVVAPITNASGEHLLSCSFASAAFDLELSFARYGTLLSALAETALAVWQHVHSRLGWPEEALSAIMAGPVPYLVSLHDFQWYCPKVRLVDERKFYCGEPPPAVCQICVRHGGVWDFANQMDLVRDDLPAWLNFNQGFLDGATAVTTSSRDTLERYQARLKLTNGRAMPPAWDAVRSTAVPTRRGMARASTLRIAIVGVLDGDGGGELIGPLLEHATRVGSPVRLRIAGRPREAMKLSRFPDVDITGPCAAGEIGRHLDAFRPDFVFLPSVWPETGSAAPSDISSSGHPLVAFDWGAPAELIRATGCGVLIAPTRDAGLPVRGVARRPRASGFDGRVTVHRNPAAQPRIVLQRHAARCSPSGLESVQFGREQPGLAASCAESSRSPCVEVPSPFRPTSSMR
jgi:hypothetical protein